MWGQRAGLIDGEAVTVSAGVTAGTQQELNKYLLKLFSCCVWAGSLITLPWRCEPWALKSGSNIHRWPGEVRLETGGQSTRVLSMAGGAGQEQEGAHVLWNLSNVTPP